MSKVSEAVDKVREKVAAKAGKFMADILTAFSPGAEDRDEAGEPTNEESAIASNVPCEYSSVSTFERVAGGASGNAATHRIKMPATEETLLIDANDRLVVEARGVTPVLTFEVVGRLDGSTTALLEVAAILKG